jgi:glutamine synthetase
VPGDREEQLGGNKQVVFEGDNYTRSGTRRPRARGLQNLRTTSDALPWLIEGQTVGVFSDYGVLSERELHSRYEVFVEQYVVKVNIEAETRPRSRGPCCCPPRCATSSSSRRPRSSP